jgi:polysaccharide chain length determinant protein (PEP-CTERM system associated)
MLPGRVYTFDDIVVMIRRRFWIIVLPVVLFGAIAMAILDQIPNKYRSDTLILVIPQRVPESYVRSTVTTRIQDRLQSISQQLLSRTRLERIIRDLDLYQAERQRMAMEDVVERMRGDIRVQMDKGDAFRVSYTATTPVMAQKVTQQLASLFIEENLRDREMLADATNAFLDTQLEDARRRLVEQEKQLEQYRVQHAGELPSQLQSNLQVSQNLQTQMQGLIDSMNRDRDRRLVLERMLLETESAPVVTAPTNQEKSPAAQLEALQQTLASLEARLKPTHPDVITTKSQIRDLEAKIAANPELAAGVREPSIVTGELARRRRLESLKAEIQTLDLQLADKESRRRDFQTQIADYETRIAAVPARESELASLTRDYETLQRMYTDLLAKREQSKVAANLERRQIGEQFNVLDPARLPERPFSPNRPLLLLAGMAAGLAFGVGLAGLLEFRDTTLRSDADIRATIALPLLGELPVIQTLSERRRRRTRVLTVSFATTSLVIAAVFLVWKFSLIAI